MAARKRQDKRKPGLAEPERNWEHIVAGFEERFDVDGQIGYDSDVEGLVKALHYADFIEAHDLCELERRGKELCDPLPGLRQRYITTRNELKGPSRWTRVEYHTLPRLEGQPTCMMGPITERALTADERDVRRTELKERLASVSASMASVEAARG